MNKLVLKLKRAIYNFLHLEEVFEKKIKLQNLLSLYENSYLVSKEVGINDKLFCEYPLIISLTSYGNRIYKIYIVIESLLQQTLKPNMIILWLSKDEFNNENIPLTLKNQIKRGLTIRYCVDIKSYKKLIPTLIHYPNSLIITVDDDTIYSKDMVENFYNSYKEDDKCIFYNRAHKIRIGKKGSIEPYLKWQWETENKEKSKLYVATGNGGIFYPVGCFHNDVIKTEIFMNDCPTTDDIWFKVMSILKGFNYQKCKGITEFIEINETQTNSLQAYNNQHKNINDISIKRLNERYKIYKLL